MASTRPTTLHTTPNDSNSHDIDFLYKCVCLALDRVSGVKSPGYPLTLKYHNNKEALAAERELIAKAATARLWLWLNANFDLAILGTMEALRLGLVDPSGVFVKKEPHPWRKAKDGRYRCINPVSLVTQVVEAVLFRELVEELKTNLIRSGSCVGIGFLDSQTRFFSGVLKDLISVLGRPVSDDMSGFDSLHTLQTMLATAKVDEACTFSPHGLVKWNRANVIWCHACVSSLAVFGSAIYVKTLSGMLTSGSFITSYKNTVLRCLYSYYIGIGSGNPVSFATSNGDDGLTFGIENLTNYETFAEKSGFPLRDVETCTDMLNFCSHLYDMKTGLASLTSWPKAVYKILTGTMTHEDAMQTVGEVRNNSELKSIVGFVYDFVPDEYDLL